MPHDVFISYSSKDKPIADGICAHLEATNDHIVRGGDWSSSEYYVRASDRSSANWDAYSNTIGFRCKVDPIP